MIAKIVLFAAVAGVAVQAGILNDLGDAGKFFTDNFHSIKDLLPVDQNSLNTNVQRVMDLLTGIKDKLKILEPMANDAQKATLGNIDRFLSQVTSFQQQAKQQGEQQFEQNKNRWSSMVTDIFEKNGLSDVIRMLKLNSGAQSYTCAALVAPIVYALLVR